MLRKAEEHSVHSRLVVPTSGTGKPQWGHALGSAGSFLPPAQRRERSHGCAVVQHISQANLRIIDRWARFWGLFLEAEL